MYDSLIALIQMLDNSEEKTSIEINEENFKVTLDDLSYTFVYNQEGMSHAISVLEDYL